MNVASTAVLGAWSWWQVIVGGVVLLLIGAIWCFRVDAYRKGFDEGYQVAKRELE